MDKISSLKVGKSIDAIVVSNSVIKFLRDFDAAFSPLVYNIRLRLCITMIDL